MNWESDTSYYWVENGQIQSAPKCSMVPDEVFENGRAMKISTAVSSVQKDGCIGRSLHRTGDDWHETVLAILEMAVDKYGETFDILYRGTHSDRPDSDHRILFATTDKNVAEFYGSVKQYRTVKGLRTKSMKLSVVTGDYTQCDDEVIFFAD